MFLCAFNFTREIMSKTIIHNVCVCVVLVNPILWGQRWQYLNSLSLWSQQFISKTAYKS